MRAESRALRWAIACHTRLAACATTAVNQGSALEGRWRSTGATFYFSLVGARMRIEFRIENGTLLTRAYPPALITEAPRWPVKTWGP